jgi:SAM-dependent methyltransferase
MTRTRNICLVLISFALPIALASPVAQAQAQTQQQDTFKPEVGQAGKDVVWVPTSEALVEKMLDMARVTAQDYVVDLGSGDGRNVIGAAKRGARALGVEYNPDMVRLSRRNAISAGVGERATFVEGDMYEAEFSQATVLALFLLPDNLNKLRAKFQDLKPGTRMVLNTFAIPEWEPDDTEVLERDCQTWCTSLLYFVPAKVGGTWRLPQGELVLDQKFQMLSGTVSGSAGTKTPITAARMRGTQITFSAAGTTYSGTVNGDSIEGTATAGTQKTSWKASRLR